jgi:hypothetical protein
VRIARQLDSGLIRGLSRLAPSFFEDWQDIYDDPDDDESFEDIRVALSGFWLFLACLTGTCVALAKHALGLSWILVAPGAVLIALMFTMAMIHGVLEGIYKRASDGSWQFAPRDSNRVFFVGMGLSTAVFWAILAA